MKACLFTVLFLSLSYSTLAVAQSARSIDQKQYTRGELSREMQSATTPEQYQALANYFRQQQESYLARAASEKITWEDRSRNSTGSGQKYPRPVDSAHYLYDSYRYSADHNGKLADRYEQLAHPAE